MSAPLVTLVVFNCGLLVGISVALVLHRRLDDQRISRALDTIGIRRKEFLFLDEQVTMLQRMQAQYAHRLTRVENLQDDRD